MKNHILILISLIMSQVTLAESISCVGKIEDWELTRAGYLYVDADWNGNEESQRVCAIRGDFDGIPGETCKIWISAIMSAIITQKTVKFKYADATSCHSGSLGEWGETKSGPTTIRSYD